MSNRRNFVKSLTSGVVGLGCCFKAHSASEKLVKDEIEFIHPDFLEVSLSANGNFLDVLKLNSNKYYNFVYKIKNKDYLNLSDDIENSFFSLFYLIPEFDETFVSIGESYLTLNYCNLQQMEVCFSIKNIGGYNRDAINLIKNNSYKVKINTKNIDSVKFNDIILMS